MKEEEEEYRMGMREQFAEMASEAGYADAYFYEVTGSTNEDAKQYLETNENPAVFLALEQTAGRGRLGRTWNSPRKRGVYVTFVGPAIADVGAVTIVCGAAVCMELRKHGFQALVKWPNDIYIDGKKVCGILAELVFRPDGTPFLLVGAGLNVDMKFDGVLSGTATSLADADVRFASSADESEDSRFLLGLHLLMESVGKIICDMRVFGTAEKKNKFIQYAREYSATINREVEIHHVHDREGYFAFAEDICEDGALSVRLENGEKRKIIAGEVTLRRDNVTDI